MYAILSHGGRQYRVSAGDRLLVDRLAAEVGSVVALEPLLLTGGDGEKTTHGKDLDGMRVAATVVAHRRGRKLRIFKYKAKKRSRKVAGYRSDLTELRVESILAKGAAIPRASAGNGAPAPRADVRAEEPTEKKPVSGQSRNASATAEKPARAATKARARADAAVDVDDAPADATVAEQPKTATTKPKPASAAKPKTSARVTKAAPKAVPDAAPKAAAPKAAPKAAKKEKETGDGA
jgi:large subunit ribosomal protein L21